MIQIDLERQPPNYEPQNEIRGTVHWNGLPRETESLDVRLIWYTEGKGDRDVGAAATESVEPVSTDGQFAFCFVAPPAPHSFSGKLISLVWAIEVIAFPECATEHVELTIAPGGKEILISGQGA